MRFATLKDAFFRLVLKLVFKTSPELEFVAKVLEQLQAEPGEVVVDSKYKITGTLTVTDPNGNQN